ncbi:MAG: hypothetical protein OXR67_07365 [Chloroflexota bacterium]|nr:hypothetical protein [Chloroflexota bacterium]
MDKQENTTNNAASGSWLEHIAQGILVAHAWVAGPAMTERERTQRKLIRAEAAGNKSSGITG